MSNLQIEVWDEQGDWGRPTGWAPVALVRFVDFQADGVTPGVVFCARKQMATLLGISRNSLQGVLDNRQLPTPVNKDPAVLRGLKERDVIESKASKVTLMCMQHVKHVARVQQLGEEVVATAKRLAVAKPPQYPQPRPRPR
jgi:hypothetical protein